MLHCQLHCQLCSYRCSIVSDTVNLAATYAPVSVTHSTLQLQMLQCQWHSQTCSYIYSNVSYAVNLAATYAPVSVRQSTFQLPMPHLYQSTLQLQMPQCQWHYGFCSCRVNHTLKKKTSLLYDTQKSSHTYFFFSWAIYIHLPPHPM